jgi:hypothetical protein
MKHFKDKQMVRILEYAESIRYVLQIPEHIVLNWVFTKQDPIWGGECNQEHKWLYRIELNKCKNFREDVANMCHELVHVKQFVHDGLTATHMHGYNYKNYPYSTTPCEVEAYTWMYPLADLVLDKSR